MGACYAGENKTSSRSDSGADAQYRRHHGSLYYVSPPVGEGEGDGWPRRKLIKIRETITRLETSIPDALKEKISLLLEEQVPKQVEDAILCQLL